MPFNFEELDEGNILYRIMYWSGQDSFEFDWVFAASEEEVDIYCSGRTDVLYISRRVATEDEVAAYKEGRMDGIMMGIYESRTTNWNGVAMRMAQDTLGMDGEELLEKVFTCGNCKKVFDFMDAAMAGNFFVATTQEDNHTLWHVCRGCAF